MIHRQVRHLSCEPTIYVSWSTWCDWYHLTCLSPQVVFTDRSIGCYLCVFFLLFVFYFCLCYTVLSDPCSLVTTCWRRADLLALLCVMLSRVFVTLPIWCPLSGVVLDCIDSWPLSSFLYGVQLSIWGLCGPNKHVQLRLIIFSFLS